MNRSTIINIIILSVGLWSVPLISTQKITPPQPTTKTSEKKTSPKAPQVTGKKAQNKSQTPPHKPTTTKKTQPTPAPAVAKTKDTPKPTVSAQPTPMAAAKPVVRYKIDGIRSVVFGKEATAIITLSDIQRPSLDGSIRQLDDIELEILLYQDALAKKMVPDEDAIDRNLNTVRKENNNMSLDQLKEIFRSAGYTYAEGRQQFRVMMAVNSILDFMIRSRLLVPEKEVQAYYDANPVYEEASYKIERAFVPFSTSLSSRALYQELLTYAQSGKLPSLAIEWSPAFWVNEDDLAQDKKFITELQVNQISRPVEISGGFELFRLLESREHGLVPLERRYAEIATMLRKPRYEKLFEEYKKALFASSSIVRFDKD